MPKRTREQVGTADIPPSASEIADMVFRRGTLIEKREGTSGQAGKWSMELGLGVRSGKTLMITMDGEMDRTGFWRHSSRLEIEVVRGKDEVELKAVLMAPSFSLVEVFEANGEPSADLGLLADTLDQAGRLMAINAKTGGRERAVAGTREIVADGLRGRT